MTNLTQFGPSRRRGRLLACLALSLPLAGCYTVDRTVPTASVPRDYHDRHPVVLANTPDYLDIFLVGPTGRLDRRQSHDLADFAAAYRKTGQSVISIRVPSGPVDAHAVDHTLDAVRHALRSYGVGGEVRVSTYPVGDPSLASPLHLSFTRLQARVASHCGDWPDDLNSGSSLNGWDNQSYYNLGCASTQTLMAQIDDPRDVLRPRAEDPTDVQLRTRAIGLLRGTPSVLPGEDPGTNWVGARLSNPISPVGDP